MSTTVDQRVVEMRFDNKQFESGVQTSLSTLDKLKKSLNLSDSVKGLETISKTASKFNLNGMNSAIETVHAKFSALEVMGVTALANITNSAVNAGKRIVSALTIDPVKTGFSEYETQINATQTILANTQSKGTTLDDVNSALDTLNAYADKTIYNFTEMTRNIGTFTAAGVDLDTSVNAIQGIANLAAVSGSNAQQASTAMYQLSQALASGTVKLMDWNSVVNAGMGGQVFQDALKETARVYGIAIDDMIVRNGSFRETLQEGWLTSEILTETLQKFTLTTEGLTEAEIEANREMLRAKGYTEAQIDEIFKLGETATNAATKVKTFTQLWDVLKEAAQSGWTQTWELLVGDFEEAQGLLTPLSDFLTGVINNMSVARNTLLEGALNSPFGELAEKIESVTSATETMVEVTKDYGDIVDRVLNGDYGNDESRWEKLAEEGYDWARVQNLVNERLNDSTRYTEQLVEAQEIQNGVQKTTIEQLIKMSDARLEEIGFTKEEVEAFRELEKQSEKTGISIEELIKDADKLSGRSLIIDSLANVFKKGLIPVLKSAREAWVDAFPPMTSEQLYDIIAAIHKMSLNFVVTEETADKLTRTFKGLFAILDIIATLTGGALKVGLKLLCKLLGMADVDILSLTASAGDAVVAFRDWLFENNRIVKGLDKLVSGTGAGIKTIGKWIDKFMSIPEVQKGIAHLDTIVANTLADLGDYFSGGIDRIEAFIERVKAMDNITLEDIDDIFEDFKENVLKYFTDIDGKFDEAKKAIADFKAEVKKQFKNITGEFDGLKGKVLEFVEFIQSKFTNIGLGEILTVGVGASLIAFVMQISKALKMVKSPIEAFTGVMHSLSGVLNSYAFKIKADALIKVALAIAVLAGSVALIAMLPEDRILSSVGAIVGLGVGLLALAAAFSVLEKFELLDGIGKVGVSIAALAGSLLILVHAMKEIESLNKDAFSENLSILVVLAAELLAVAIVLSTMAPKLSTGAIFLLSFSGALYVLVQSLKSINDLDLTNIKDSLDVLLSVMVGLGLVALAASKSSLGSAASILAVAVSLKILVSAIDDISNMEPSKILDNVGMFITIFGMFAILTAASSKAGAHAAKAGVAVLAMSVSLLIIIEAFKKIAELDKSELKKALGSISTILLVFGAVVALSNFAGEHAAKAGAMLLMMSGALLILSVVITILSHLDPSGLARAVGAIVALQLCFAVLIGVTKLAQDCKVTLGILAGTIGLLAIALGVLSMIDPNGLKTATIALSSVIAMFALLVASTKFAQTAVGALAVATLVVAGLGYILYKLSDLPVENTLGVAAGLSVLLLSLSGALVILSAVGAAAVPALIGIGVLSVLILALAAVMGAITLAFAGVATGLGVLSDKIPEFEEFLDKGLPILEKIAYGIGSFLGNIIAGFSAGVTSGLPEIGTHLSDFITNAEPFLTSIKNVDASGVEAAKMLAELILILTAADILNAITSLSMGSSSFASFGSELAEFGKCLVEYSDSVANVKTENITNSVDAAKGLVELANNLPNSGGLAGKLLGENDWATFSSGLVAFGTTLKNYGVVVEGVKTKAIEESVGAAEGLVDLSNALPNGGPSVLGFFVGDNDWVTFSTGLVHFGIMLKNYGDTVEGVKATAIEESVDAAKGLVELAETFPNSGGLAGFFAGENGFAQFADGLSDFGKKLKEYSDSVAGINVKNVSNSVDAATELTELAKGIPNKGGILENIVSFGENLVMFGVSFVACYASLKTVNPEQLISVIEGVNELIRLTQNMSEVDSTAVANFSKSLEKIGQNGVDEFVKTFTNATPRVKSAIDIMLNASISGAKGTYSDFYEVGAYLVEGFAKGITDNSYKAVARAKAMAKSAETAAKKELDEHSPSKVFFGIGKYVVEGFANGIRDSIHMSDDQTENMANSAIDTTNKALEINSPSKKFKQIGIYVVQGFCDGIIKHKKSIKSVLDDTFVNNVASSMKALEKTYKSALETIGAIAKTITNSTGTYTQLSETIIKIGDGIYIATKNFKSFEDIIADVGKELYKESDAYKESSANIDEYNKTIDDLKKQRKKLNKELKTSTNQDEIKKKIKEIDEQIKETNQAILDEEKKMAQDSMQIFNDFYESFRSNVESSLDLLTTSMDSQTDLFKKFEVDTEITTTSILENMESQIKGVSEWNSNLDKLAEKGLATGLLEKLRDMGPEGAGYVNAFLNMTSSELAKANELFNKETQLSTDALLNNMKDKLTSVKEWAANMSALAAKGIDQGLLKQLAEMGPEGTDYVEAFLNMTGAELGEVNKIYAETVTLPDTVAAQLVASYAYAGTDAAKGLANGLKNGQVSAEQAAQQLATATLNAVKEVLNINSPSKEFEAIGKYSDSGLVVGLKKYSGNVSNAAEEVADTAIDSMSRTMSKISEVINSDMDSEPVIRPVLDLSNVEAGARSINATLSKTQAMSVSASMNKSSVVSDTGNGTTPSGGTSYQFTQNNYSPKALSRVDIYRQTKNQFAAMKGLVQQ